MIDDSLDGSRQMLTRSKNTNAGIDWFTLLMVQKLIGKYMIGMLVASREFKRWR